MRKRATQVRTDVDPDLNVDLEHSFAPPMESHVIDLGAVSRHAWAHAWQNRTFLLMCGFLGFVGCFVATFLIPVQYESTTLLMPPDQTNSSGMALISALASKAGELGLPGDLLGNKNSGAVFVGILRSRTVTDDLVESFDLRRVYWRKYRSDARRKLQSRTEISEDRKSGIISITVTDHDPRRAASIARGYVAELNRLAAQLTTSSAHRERVFLEQRLESVSKDLNNDEVEFSQFASKNTAIDIPAQGKAMVESAAQLQGELVAAQSELSGMEQIYSQSNVRVRSLKARVDELSRQLNKLAGDGTTEGTAIYPSIRKLPVLGVQYADLYRKVKVQEAVYEALTKQYELAKVQEAKEIPTVKVLDEADVPERKAFPPRMLFASLGAVLSFLGGLFFASRVRDRESPENAARLMVMRVTGQTRDVFRRLSGRTNGTSRV